MTHFCWWIIMFSFVSPPHAYIIMKGHKYHGGSDVKLAPWLGKCNLIIHITSKIRVWSFHFLVALNRNINISSELLVSFDLELWVSMATLPIKMNSQNHYIISIFFAYALLINLHKLVIHLGVIYIYIYYWIRFMSDNCNVMICSCF